MRILLLFFVAVSFHITVHSQTMDKADADRLIYKELSAGYMLENWHPELAIGVEQVVETAERGVYIVKGDSFQVKSIRSDFYVTQRDGEWIVLNDSRYPLETAVNLLLNRIETNSHQLNIRHHQYGDIKLLSIPMQSIYDLLARNMQLYCSITHIDKDEIRAVLIFHQSRMDFIHMLELTIPTQQLFNGGSTFTGELFTNIPQNNIYSLFREKGDKK